MTSDAAHDAAFHRAGLLRVNDLDELFAAAETLGRARAAEAGRLAIVSNGEGLAALAAGRLRQIPGAAAVPAPRLVRTAAEYHAATAELLAEELRRLDPDEVYAETLHHVGVSAPAELPQAGELPAGELPAGELPAGEGRDDREHS